MRLHLFSKSIRSSTAIGLAIAGMAVLIYHDVLTLPFYLDDLGIIPWMERCSLWEMWTNTGGMVYYRPLTFFLRKGIALLMGNYHPAIHHAINLITHIINGWLVAYLTSKLWPGPQRQMRSLAAGAIFTLFPFSYQAIPWVTSLPHTQTTLLVLGSTSAYLQSRSAKKGARLWWAAALILAVLAPFSHETGLLIVPLLFLVESTRPDRPALLARTLRLLPFAIPIPLYLILRSLILGERELSLPGLETLFQNGMYFIQGIAFPLEPAAGRWLISAVGDMAAAGLVGAAALLFAVIVQRSRWQSRSFLPWLWSCAAWLPAWLMLPFDYVINGPRLLYLASVGIAWLWADVIANLAVRFKFSYLGKIAWALLLTCSLLPGILFIRERMLLHQMGGQMIQQMTERALESDQAAGRPALFVNLTSWLAPRKSVYPLGHEGVEFFPSYVSVPEIVYANSQQWIHGEAVKFGDITQETPYWFGLYGKPVDWAQLASRIWSSQAVYLSTTSDHSISVRPAGAPLESNPDPWLVSFGDSVFLEDVSVQADQGDIELELVWRYAGGADDATIFVHALDANGEIVAQADGYPIGRMLPFRFWQPGQRAQDIRWLPSGQITQLRIGLYRPSGERLTAVDAGGLQLPDDAFSITIERSN